MYEYLRPRTSPVFLGLEHKEIVFAKDQPEYIPLMTIVSAGPDRRVISRWTLTDRQRQAVANGADVFLELSTFGHPLQPIRMAVSDGLVNPDWVRTELLDETLPPAKQSKLCPMEPVKES